MSRLGLRISIASLTVLFLLVGQGADALQWNRESPLADVRAGGFLGFGGDDYRCPDCNVILISIDTLRADHVGAYGYERDTTPSVDRMARDSVIFSTAIAHAPSTLASHSSIFTSMIPEHHKASHSRERPLPDEAVTLAEVLFAAGFRNAAFVSGAQMHPRWNLAQGFDVYDSVEGKGASHSTKFSEIVAKGTAWMDEHLDEQFFVLLHTYEIHTPYNPRADYRRMFEPEYEGRLANNLHPNDIRRINHNRAHLTPADKEHIVTLYDAEIRHVDDSFGDLIGFLQDRGLYDRTLIIFTSDHGEEFGERGWWGWHTRHLYDELLKVPLIFKLPDSAFADSRIHEIARQIDILPTVLDVLDIEPAGPFEGQSLIDLVLGRRRDAVFAIAQQDIDRDGEIPTAIRTKRWKLYDGALFDLALDPMERVDVSAEHPFVTASLEINLQLLRSGFTSLEEADAVEMSPELREELRALGYIQ